jgi:hypothetical protein
MPFGLFVSATVDRRKIRSHSQQATIIQGGYMLKSDAQLKPIGLVLSIFIFMILTLPAAMAFNYGKLQRDRETTRIFKTHKVVPDHKYYTSGQGNIPYAIIGIHNDYTLRQGLWKQVNISTQLLRGWVDQMHIIYGFQPYGSKIVDNRGKQVGIWFSSKQWTTVVLEEDNVIAVFTPEAPGFRQGR